MRIKMTSLGNGLNNTSHTVRIFDVAEFSKHDGPGARVVIYFQGCNLHCDWCHSPHSQPIISSLLFNENVCVGCQRCAEACTQNVHIFANGKHLIDRSKCIRCGRCIEVCPNSIDGVKGSALHLPTTELPVHSLFSQIEPYIRLTGASGGVTLSGGESLTQLEAARELLTLCKAHGFHTAVETSGLLRPEVYKSVLPLVDLWLFGVRITTGKKDRLHIERLRQVLDMLTLYQADILPRIPMVPGFFDRDDILQLLTDLLRSYHLDQVSLGPWNRDFDHHYIQSGMPRVMGIPSLQQIEACERKMTTFFKSSNYNLI